MDGGLTRLPTKQKHRAYQLYSCNFDLLHVGITGNCKILTFFWPQLYSQNVVFDLEILTLFLIGKKNYPLFFLVTLILLCKTEQHRVFEWRFIKNKQTNKNPTFT